MGKSSINQTIKGQITSPHPLQLNQIHLSTWHPPPLLSQSLAAAVKAAVPVRRRPPAHVANSRRSLLVPATPSWLLHLLSLLDGKHQAHWCHLCLRPESLRLLHLRRHPGGPGIGARDRLHHQGFWRLSKS